MRIRKNMQLSIQMINAECVFCKFRLFQLYGTCCRSCEMVKHLSYPFCNQLWLFQKEEECKQESCDDYRKYISLVFYVSISSIVPSKLIVPKRGKQVI